MFRGDFGFLYKKQIGQNTYLRFGTLYASTTGRNEYNDNIVSNNFIVNKRVVDRSYGSGFSIGIDKRKLLEKQLYLMYGTSIILSGNNFKGEIETLIKENGVETTQFFSVNNTSQSVGLVFHFGFLYNPKGRFFLGTEVNPRVSYNFISEREQSARTKETISRKFQSLDVNMFSSSSVRIYAMYRLQKK